VESTGFKSRVANVPLITYILKLFPFIAASSGLLYQKLGKYAALVE
jgi:hypothetical protein